MFARYNAMGRRCNALWGDGRHAYHCRAVIPDRATDVFRSWSDVESAFKIWAKDPREKIQKHSK